MPVYQGDPPWPPSIPSPDGGTFTPPSPGDWSSGEPDRSFVEVGTGAQWWPIFLGPPGPVPQCGGGTVDQLHSAWSANDQNACLGR